MIILVLIVDKCKKSKLIQSDVQTLGILIE